MYMQYINNTCMFIVWTLIYVWICHHTADISCTTISTSNTIQEFLVPSISSTSKHNTWMHLHSLIVPILHLHHIIKSVEMSHCCTLYHIAGKFGEHYIVYLVNWSKNVIGMFLFWHSTLLWVDDVIILHVLNIQRSPNLFLWCHQNDAN